MTFSQVLYNWIFLALLKRMTTTGVLQGSSQTTTLIGHDLSKESDNFEFFV
jgi:hypothetical protein